MDLMADPNESNVDGNDSPSVSESSLLRLKHCEAETWERIVSLYYPYVFYICQKKGLQPEDTEDVIQDVFQGVFKSLPNYSPEKGGFRRWLGGILHHKLQDFWRKKSAMEAAIGGSESQRMFNSVTDVEEDSVEECELDGGRVILQIALRLIELEFEQKTWQAVWRLLVEGDSPDEVAARLGVTRNAVYKSKSRVLTRIRTKMGDLLE